MYINVVSISVKVVLKENCNSKRNIFVCTIFKLARLNLMSCIICKLQKKSFLQSLMTFKQISNQHYQNLLLIIFAKQKKN